VHSILRMRRFPTPYRWTIVLALVMLAIGTAADLAIPRLAQTVIDQGIASKDVGLILRLSLGGLGATLLSAALRGFYYHLYMSQLRHGTDAASAS